MIVKYNEVLSQFYPNLKFASIGDGLVYEKLIPVQGQVLPSKMELDQKYLIIAKEKMWRKIQVERDRRRAAGVKVGNYWFHSDDTSRIQQLGLLLYGSNMPDNLMWKTLSGEFVLMTPTLAQQIFAGIAMADQKIFTVAEQHKALMYAAEDPESYNYLTSGPVWPKIYGEA